MKGGKVMKNILILSLSLIPCSLFLTGCKDYLTEKAPGATGLEEFFTSTEAAVQSVTASYTPLLWEYDHTYCPEWFIGDVASDDALKGGGSIPDMGDLYDIENWRTTDQNTMLLDFYRAQYQGIGRCNLALTYINNMEVGIDKKFSDAMKNRLLGELHFLRAYYYFRLVRVFAGVPIIKEIADDSDKWGVPRASVDETFQFILEDLENAEALLPVRSSSLFAEVDLGRATKGAAQAMLLKVNLYMASKYWSKQVTKSQEDCYADAYMYGKQVIDSHEYSLCDNYEDNFTLVGENGPESIFELQYQEFIWDDYGSAYTSKFGYTVGTFTRILIRSRASIIGGGWGFNHPTQNLYDEFEEGDIRRDVAILDPQSSKVIEEVKASIIRDVKNPSQEFIDSIMAITSVIQNPTIENYLGSFYLNNKYGMYRDSLPKDCGGGFGTKSTHASRGSLNNRQIRYADVLLMCAEAALGKGETGEATDWINEVRARVNLQGIDVADDASLRHERRCELAMEGHRWFDLVRWEGVDGNGLKGHMDAYKAQETEEARSHMQEFVAGKHEIFPIPQEELQLNPTHMSQNPGY